MAKRLNTEDSDSRLVSVNPEDGLSTGITMLNLALSGDPNWGLLAGRYFYFVGDSSSGKTFFTHTILAEAARNPRFDDYRLIYDDVEGGALMDLEAYFGSKLASRIEPPAGTRDDPQYSSMVEEFYFNLDDAFLKKTPFIYVLDSQDSLDSLYARKKFKKLKAAASTGGKIVGDFGDGKAKFHSTRLRAVTNKLRENGSILIIINQTRDVLNTTPFGPKTQASGGRALRFYACAQIWTSVNRKITRVINKNKRQIGIDVKVAIKKNRISGKEWSLQTPIYFSSGVDDIGSCVDFICGEGRWSRNEKTGTIRADDFEGVTGSLDKVVEKIEEMGMEDEVRDIATELFNEITEASSVKRKKRYE